MKSIAPMIGVSYEKHKDKVKYPCYIQPKIDGFRAIIKNKKIYSRTMKEMNLSLPSLPSVKYILDGELYVPKKSIFELKSIIKKEPHRIKFICFDIVDPTKTFEERCRIMKTLSIPVIETKLVKNERELLQYKTKYEKQYEGVVIRNRNGMYKYGVSYDVFVTKRMYFHTFRVVDAKKNKQNGILWEVRCLHSNKTFTVRPTGTLQERQRLYKNRNKLIGKNVLVKYKEINKNGCVTRFPVGVSIVQN